MSNEPTNLSRGDIPTRDSTRPGRVVIHAAKRFAHKRPLPPNPQRTEMTAESRAHFAPSVKSLPFVSDRWGNECWPESMWADVPTNDYHADCERGKLFANLTISALIADKPAHHCSLELIFKAIVEDAVRRKAKGGKGSRTMPAAVQGYLETLAKFIIVHCRGE
jgi:hypothetical protein